MGVVNHRANNNALVTNAVALMTATVGSAGLGLAFWVVAAHMFNQDTVGRASAQVAAVTLVAGLGQLSIVSIFARFLPVARARTTRILKAGYGITLSASFVVAVGFVLFGFGSDFLDRGAWPTLFFVVAALVFAIFSLQDVVLTAFRRATWVLWENVGVAAVRLAALPLLFFFGRSLGVFGAWAIPMIGAVGVVSVLVFARLAPVQVRLGDDGGLLPNRSELLNYSFSQYVNAIITSVGGLLPPVLVVSLLGARASAAFYLPWLFCTASAALLWNIEFSLVVEAVHNMDRTQHLLARAAGLGALVTCGGGVVLGLGAPWILGIAGASYRADGTVVLRLLALSMPFIGVYSLYSALALITKRTWMSTALDGLGAAIFLGGGVASASRYGLAGFGLAFLVSRVVIALASVPGIVVQYRRLGVPDETLVLELDRNLPAMAAETQVLYPILAARGVARVAVPATRGTEYRSIWRGGMSDARTEVLVLADDRTELLPRDDDRTRVLTRDRAEVLLRADEPTGRSSREDRVKVLAHGDDRDDRLASANDRTVVLTAVDRLHKSRSGHGYAGTTAAGGGASDRIVGAADDGIGDSVRGGIGDGVQDGSDGVQDGGDGVQDGARDDATDGEFAGGVGDVGDAPSDGERGKSPSAGARGEEPLASGDGPDTANSTSDAVRQ